MSKYEEQAKRLQKIKAHLGLKHDQELASVLDVSQSSVSAYVNGNTLSLKAVINLYKEHKISPLWFLFGKGPMIEGGEQTSLEVIRDLVSGLSESDRKVILKDLMSEIL